VPAFRRLTRNQVWDSTFLHDPTTGKITEVIPLVPSRAKMTFVVATGNVITTKYEETIAEASEKLDELGDIIDGSMSQGGLRELIDRFS
jgi:hypothetical protein